MFVAEKAIGEAKKIPSLDIGNWDEFEAPRGERGLQGEAGKDGAVGTPGSPGGKIRFRWEGCTM